MIYEVRTLKRLSTFIALILFAAAVVVPSLKVLALYDYKIENTAELSIPDNIGIEIPETNEGVPIIGIIMWALVAVVAMAALLKTTDWITFAVLRPTPGSFTSFSSVSGTWLLKSFTSI